MSDSEDHGLHRQWSLCTEKLFQYHERPTRLSYFHSGPITVRKAPFQIGYLHVCRAHPEQEAGVMK